MQARKYDWLLGNHTDRRHTGMHVCDHSLNLYVLDSALEIEQCVTIIKGREMGSLDILFIFSLFYFILLLPLKRC